MRDRGIGYFPLRMFSVREAKPSAFYWVEVFMEEGLTSLSYRVLHA